MRIPLQQALHTAQMIIPEVDLGVHSSEGKVQVSAVPLNQWHYYLDAIENSTDYLLEELAALPDIKPITEIEAIVEDISCLVTSLNVFYACTMDEIKKLNEHRNPDISNQLDRFSKYRRKIERNPEREF